MSLDELKQLQNNIIEKNKKYKIIFSIIIIAIILISVRLLHTRGKSFIDYIGPMIFEVALGLSVSSIIRSIIIHKDVEKFEAEFKNIFVLNSLKKIFDNISYTPEYGFDESIIKNTGMMKTGDRYYSNDYISGKYKTISFEQSDIHIENERTDKDGDTYVVTMFKGRWMIFDFNKIFKSNIQVASNDFDCDVLRGFKQYSKVRMEDIEFNKNFSVYAENDHDVFYILTPHFMEKLKKLKEELNCGIMFCFIDNKLHIAIDNNDDSFEHDVLKKIDEIEIENNILKDIKLITNFIDELDLDNDLFRKGV